MPKRVLASAVFGGVAVLRVSWLVSLFSFWLGFFWASAIYAATNTQVFSYPDRTAFLADGWSFVAVTSAGLPRNTETTLGPGVLSYDQTEHPGVLRVPVDAGDMWGSANNSRNSMFRPLSPDWTSIQLDLAFSPTNSYQQAQLAIYQDDDNYVETGVAFNGSENVALITEAHGVARAVSSYPTLATNASLRLERNATSGDVTASVSLNGANWVVVGSTSQALLAPMLSIWTGGSDGSAFPPCDLQRLQIVTSDSPIRSTLAAAPPELVFSTVAGSSCTNLQQVNIGRLGPAALNWSITAHPAWVSIDSAGGVDSSSCNVSVNSAGLAPGVYQGGLTLVSTGAFNSPLELGIKLIVNPPVRARVATWRGGKPGVMTVWVDDGAPTAFDDLVAHNAAGTYVMNGSNAPAYFSMFYQAGMELGAHLYDHTCALFDASATRTQIVSNLAGLCATATQPCADAVCLAWPCGATSTNMQLVAADYFLCARGYNLNQLEDPTPRNFMNLNSFNSHQHTPYPPDDLKTVVDAAIAQGKWFIMVLHAYTNYDDAISYAATKDIWMASAGSVSKYIMQRDRTIVSNYVENPGAISFDLCRLPIAPSSQRSFETAIHPSDTVSVQVDLGGIPEVLGVLVDGQPSANYLLRSVQGVPSLVFETALTTVPRNIELLMPTNYFKILSIAVADDMATVVWSSNPGQAYRLQYKENVTQSTWLDSTPDLVATGYTCTASHSIGASQQQVYRVISKP